MFKKDLTNNRKVATREAYGQALVELGKINNKIIVLDAETSNSTYAIEFKKVFPERFFEMFIAEQNMVSVALGLDKSGFVPFVSSFAAFLTRAFDQLRMAQYSDCNIKLVGSHCGVSIGEDGPSQMGLEDLAMSRSLLRSVVFYPSDEVSTRALVRLMAENKGLFYLRLTREKTPLLYSTEEKFNIGGSKVHLADGNNSGKILIISAGITLFEALKAQKELIKKNIKAIVLDCYSVKPLDKKTIIKFAQKAEKIIVVEDHYPAGGLGEAVALVLAENNLCSKKFIHLCVKKIPHSGKPGELLSAMAIDWQAIYQSATQT